MAANATALMDEAAAKMARLEARLRGLDRLMVAYSGGVDSSFLAATAYRVMGARMVAVLADSPSLARQDLAEAREFAAAQGFPLEIVATGEMEQPEYARNDAQRCFHCKSALFAAMEALGARRGFRAIAYGLNLDDRGDYRPGQRAAAEHAVLAPLAEAGLSKAEVRLLAREAGFAFWDRPAAPCLASRIEYGRAVTAEALQQVEEGEAFLHGLGFRELRLRHHGAVARIEIAREELARALSLDLLERIDAGIKALGFQYVALDCAGFRSGSLNALLPVEVLQGHGL